MRLWLCLIATIGVCGALPVAAQPAPAPSESEGAAEPSESEGAAAPAESITAPQATSQEDATRAEAMKHFEQGIAFADAGDCGAAIAEFEVAYGLVPRPSMLYNIAQCQERLFRYDLAIRYYERYLAEAPPDAQDRAAVEAALRTLRNLLGVVVIQSNVEAEVWVDDRLAGEAPGEVLVPAGGHSIELRTKGYIPTRTEVRVVGQQRVEINLTLVIARTTVHVTEKTGLPPVLFYVGAGATVVAAGIGGVFALRVKSLHDDALELPEPHPDRTERRKEVEDAELTADIFFGSALLFGVGTTIVAFLTDWGGDGEATGDGAVGVEALLAPGAAGAVLRGAF